MSKEFWAPDYKSGNRNNVGSGGSRKGFCGIYGEVPIPVPEKKPEQKQKRNQRWYPR